MSRRKRTGPKPIPKCDLGYNWEDEKFDLVNPMSAYWLRQSILGGEPAQIPEVDYTDMLQFRSKYN